MVRVHPDGARRRHTTPGFRVRCMLCAVCKLGVAIYVLCAVAYCLQTKEEVAHEPILLGDTFTRPSILPTPVFVKAPWLHTYSPVLPPAHRDLYEDGDSRPRVRYL